MIRPVENRAEEIKLDPAPRPLTADDKLDETADLDDPLNKRTPDLIVKKRGTWHITGCQRGFPPPPPT